MDVSSWSERYADRVDGWRLPTPKAKREELSWAFTRDGYPLLEAVRASASPLWLRGLPAVRIPRIVLVQNYTRRIAGNGRR